MADKEVPFVLKVAGAVVDLGLFTGLCALLAPHAAAPVLPIWPALILFALAVLGAAEVVTTSEIVYPLAQLAGRIPLIGPSLYREEPDEIKKETIPHGMLACPMCMGMWLGVLAGAAGLSLWQVSSMGDLIAHGCIGAALTPVLHKKL